MHKWWQNFLFFFLKWTITLNAFFRQSVNARKCSTKAPQRLSNAFNYFKPANSLWLKAYFTIRAAFFHVCGASGGLVFFLFFFLLLGLSSWALSDGAVPSESSPLQSIRTLQKLPVSVSLEFGVTLAMLCSSSQLSQTHCSSWNASRRRVLSVLPEEKSLALALPATAMDYIYLFMYCTINLLFLDYRQAAKSHGKRSWFMSLSLFFSVIFHTWLLFTSTFREKERACIGICACILNIITFYIHKTLLPPFF